VGQGFSTWLAANRGLYPFSYWYPNNEEGLINFDRLAGQDPLKRYGYVHWSHLVYDTGGAREDAFQCPQMQNGGLPPTNPGPDRPDIWEPNQVDDQCNDGPGTSTVSDRQVRRLAYTANAAIIPRNKFEKAVVEADPVRRYNQLVSDSTVRHVQRTVLATEFFDSFNAVSKIGTGSCGEGTRVSKSHRPLMAFKHLGVGVTSNWEYTVPENNGSFVYSTEQVPEQERTFGILKAEALGPNPAYELIEGGGGVSQLNAVGRHHPAGDKGETFGGTANFLYCDMHVENKNVWETMAKREWGDAYYSLTGENGVLDFNVFNYGAGGQ
jgi:hypothetical protein